jgi:uncharacterized protein (TIGR00255 family)
MISSMTGFGSAEGALGNGRVVVEVRAVNHRFLTPAVKLPQALTRFEGEIRDTLRRYIARGHVTVTVRTLSDATAGRIIDEERFASYARELQELADRHGMSGTVDLATVLRLPGVVNDEAREPRVESAEQLLHVVEKALDELARMRLDEGRRIAAGLLERLGLIEAAVERIAARSPKRLRDQHERLKRAVGDLAAGVAVDPQRLAQEVAIMADKLDVSEEIDRFRVHLTAFRATLADATGESVGKRLSFLMQEMLREANTTGSKANDSPMLSDVVSIKEELERVREQVENLE